MAWEKKHLNPFMIEDYLHDTYGLVSPIEYLYGLTPDTIKDFVGQEKHHTMVTEDEMYKFGIMETAFKFQPREHVTCFNNGRYFLYSTILMT